MERNLFRYIWNHTRADQLWLLGVVLVSMPIYFLSLDLPKRIVNGPIEGRGFEAPGVTQTIFKIDLAIPGFLGGGTWHLFDGLALERMPYLIALCLIFLALVCINGLFKFYINTFKGRIGERMLRRMRYELVDRVLRFPYGHFRRIKAPEIATMVKDEVEPLGGFIGDSYVSPVLLGGQALTAMIFIMVQNLWLGLIAGGIVGAQAIIIPRLRRRLLELGKQRQLTARELAGRVGEIVDSIAEIRTNDTSNFERASIATRLERIFFIRFEYYRRKFFVKFLNNFLAQVTPFLFFLFGGYFVIRGSMDIGQLVAVIAAYKDLPSPIKELIDWDQRRLDVEIKYSQVVEQFAPEGMVEAHHQLPVDDPLPAFAGPIQIESLSRTDDTGAQLVENVSFTIEPGEHIAVVGEVNAGGEEVAEALARLSPPDSGSIRVGGASFFDLSEAVTGRRIAYVGPESSLPNVSLRDNLLYSLKHEPATSPHDIKARKGTTEYREAVLSGNTTFLLSDDWIDYQSAGIEGPEAITERLHEVLTLTDLEQDVFDFGLRSRVDIEKHGDWSKKLMQARTEMRAVLSEPEYKGLIETFSPESYNNQTTIGANILFGNAQDAAFESAALAANPFIRGQLATDSLDEVLFGMGREIAETMIELFSDLEAGNTFFEQLTFMTPEELPAFETALSSTSSCTFADAREEDRAAFLRLAFAYIEPRHRLNLISENLRESVVEMRQRVRSELARTQPDAVAFYDPEKYNPAATLQDNILFGRLVHGVANGAERITAAVQDVLDRLDLRDLVFEAGLQFVVGAGGRRLTAVQRQKVALSRALLKRPSLLVVNRGLVALGARSQEQLIKRTLAAARGNGTHAPFATFWVLSYPRYAEMFTRVLVFESGKLRGQGTPEDLLKKDGLLTELIH